MTSEERVVPTPPEEERSPLGSWNRVYAALLVYLFGLIGLFWLFSRAFS